MSAKYLGKLTLILSLFIAGAASTALAQATPPHAVNIRYDITVGAASLEVYEALEFGNFPNTNLYWVNAQVDTQSQTCNVIDLHLIYNLPQSNSAHCTGGGNAFKAYYLVWDSQQQQSIPFVKRIECQNVNEVYFTTSNESYVYGSGTYTLIPFGIFQPFPSYC